MAPGAGATHSTTGAGDSIFDSDVIQTQCSRKNIKYAIGNVLREDELDPPNNLVTISRDLVNLRD